MGLVHDQRMTGADENGNPLPIQISPSTVPIWCPVVA